MKIISWNVNGIRSVYKKRFSESIEKINPDIICLQEIKSNIIPQTSDLFSTGLEEKYYSYINPAQRLGYSGTMVFSKNKPRSVIGTIGFSRFDCEGRFQEIVFNDFTLINVYIPHGARDKRNLNYKLKALSILKKYLSIKDKTPYLLCGDFNVAISDIDLANPDKNRNNIMFTKEEKEELTKIINLGLVDSFRKFNIKPRNYTWWPYRNNLRERNIGWRIDYIFVDKLLEFKMNKSFILKDVYGSDHCPVGIELAF